MGAEAGGSLAVAAADRIVGADTVAAAGDMAAGGRSEACSNAGWGGSARARDAAAGAEAGRGSSGEKGRRLVVETGCVKVGARAAAGDEAIAVVVGRGLSRAAEGDWGRWWSRCSILGLPW